MPRLLKIEPRDGFRLYLEFADGITGEVELKDELWGPVFEPLRDPAEFAKVTLDDFGAPCWPNGADYAPDAAYLALRRKGEGAA
ncbi:MAG: DUF2442 domain-containing protein [Candidatus Sericytochromatia bacterium]|nr:DUF2442 domain-containing protein [Candidatus Tanganyikabacteria bacterium]